MLACQNVILEGVRLLVESELLLKTARCKLKALLNSGVNGWKVMGIDDGLSSLKKRNCPKYVSRERNEIQVSFT